ncbi:hypothetical protein LTR56_001897 [Elasticomyces elasticus]|nr:hypothetical protein LTR56_001897 [Elasticomyces elasticus]KAK3668752.1 hypothetical protein LTR22_000232 [Elasticomyces elasticus]KAK4930592.1 hypothetical protein LTR49_003006 [Elasticomyces elasticus]KAK5757911.1 hypothetical protein LTS12_011950 [Elasticomyces elasticus]
MPERVSLDNEVVGVYEDDVEIGTATTVGIVSGAKLVQIGADGKVVRNQQENAPPLPSRNPGRLVAPRSASDAKVEAIHEALEKGMGMRLDSPIVPTPNDFSAATTENVKADKDPPTIAVREIASSHSDDPPSPPIPGLRGAVVYDEETGQLRAL